MDTSCPRHELDLGWVSGNARTPPASQSRRRLWTCVPGSVVNGPLGHKLKCNLQGPTFSFYFTQRETEVREGGWLALGHAGGPQPNQAESQGLWVPIRWPDIDPQSLSQLQNTKPCAPLFFGRGGDLSHPYRVVGSQEWKWRGEKDGSLPWDPFLPETLSCLMKKVRGRRPLTCWAFNGSPILEHRSFRNAKPSTFDLVFLIMYFQMAVPSSHQIGNIKKPDNI